MVKHLLQRGRPGFNPWVWKISWRRKWQPTPIFLPGKSHWLEKNLVGYSPWIAKLDMTERLRFHLSFFQTAADLSDLLEATEILRSRPHLVLEQYCCCCVALVVSDSVRPHRRQAPGFPSLGFSRQEHWSGLPFPSPMHESEKWKWSRSVVSDSSDPMDCSPPGSSVHGIFQARILEWGATVHPKNYASLPLPREFPRLSKVKWSRSVVSNSLRPYGL